MDGRFEEFRLKEKSGEDAVARWRRVLLPAVSLAIPSVGAAPLVEKILEEYPLDPGGIHGPGHWLRVMAYGRLLAAQNGAGLKVLALFGLLHDARRFFERRDPGHGARAAVYARRLAGEGLLEVPSRELDLLCRACAGHTGGLGHPELTVATCWDADRLDLHRFGWEIDPAQLNTAEAVAFVSRPEPPFLETFLTR